MTRMGLIGYGEVGGIFAAGLRAQVSHLLAWDIKQDDPVQAPAMQVRAAEQNVQLTDGVAALCAGSDLIISAVTASSARDVAQQAAAHLRPGQVYLDVNSVSPGAKKAMAQAVMDAGASYVEAGVMSSVPPHGIKVPMLLCGPDAEPLAQTLNAWGMQARVVSPTYGVASAIKMCRSIMIKGMEALVAESYATARAYGVEAHVLPTLAATFPAIDWPQQGAYFYQRMVQHGRRRAAEMHEAAATVAQIGLEPLMATASARKQGELADLAAAGAFAAIDMNANTPWQDYADCLLAQRTCKADDQSDTSK